VVFEEKKLQLAEKLQLVEKYPNGILTIIDQYLFFKKIVIVNLKFKVSIYQVSNKSFGSRPITN
jgi:hypothetical protein